MAEAADDDWDEDEQRVCHETGKTFTFEELELKLCSTHTAEEVTAHWNLMKPIGQEASSESAPSERAFAIAEFVEVAMTEGPYAGCWIACQIVSAGGTPATHNIFIPAQPPYLEADAMLPNVPEAILRKTLSPADPLVLGKHYPVPRMDTALASNTVLGWYDGKPEVKGRTLRVLVLHGTSSNSQIMKSQIAPLRVACKDQVEFIHAEGTIDASSIPGNPQYALMSKVFPGQDLFQYANYAPDRGFDYADLDRVTESLQAFMKENAPIDGVLGTGQGSNIATLLAAQAVCGLGMPLSFVVHHGGTASAWTWRFPHLYKEALRIPSFHVTGQRDPFLHGIPILAHLYDNPETVTHSEDHRPYPRDRKEAGDLTANVLAFMKKSSESKGKGGEEAAAAPARSVGA